MVADLCIDIGISFGSNVMFDVRLRRYRRQADNDVRNRTPRCEEQRTVFSVSAAVNAGMKRARKRMILRTQIAVRVCRATRQTAFVHTVSVCARGSRLHTPE